MTKTILFPDIITTPGDLLDHNMSRDLNLRILNTLSGSSLLCIIIREVPHSFLIGLPCKLVVYKHKKRVIERYLPINFYLIPRSSLLGVVPCFGEFEYFYIQWLLEQGPELYPELITEKYVKLLKDRLGEFKEDVKTAIENLESIAEEPEENESSTIIALPESNTRH